MLIGTLVNSLAVIAGSSLGLLIGKRFPEHISNAVMKAVALCIILIGIKGMLEGSETLIVVISMVLGTIIGEWLDLEGHFTAWAEKLNGKFGKTDGKTTVSQGFITASLLFCIGAMAVVGSLADGLTGDHAILFTKSALDFTTSAIIASALGFGVMLSAVAIFVYQGTIALLASFIAPWLNNAAIAEISCAGSLVIFAMGLNMMEITKLKIMNYLPAIILPAILLWIKGLF